MARKEAPKPDVAMAAEVSKELVSLLLSENSAPITQYSKRLITWGVVGVLPTRKVQVTPCLVLRQSVSDQCT